MRERQKNNDSGWIERTGTGDRSANPYVTDSERRSDQVRRDRYHQEELDQDWQQSWERAGVPEGDPVTAADWLLAVLIVILILVIAAMGVYWFLYIR